jgi:hypothetical protein
LRPLLLQAAASSQPAGGAAIGEIVTATVAALVITAALLILGVGHRTGRVALLGRAADRLERLSGLPGWTVLPSAVATSSLLIAVFGMYWDISLHIDVGRDPGPLANPAHYFILFGLFGIFSAGFLAMVLPKEHPSSSAVHMRPGWDAPLGGVLICACGAFSLMGFPLDDMWHRLFGQDVTLWGPTHLMLIGGAAMTLIGIAVLLVEGTRARKAAGIEHDLGWVHLVRRVALTGGFLIGLSTFQGEFDFGVPQFRFVFEPMLVMLAASVALVATRLWLGKGAALGAVAFFLVIRGGLALLVGPILGETTPHFPLYIVEALIAEGVALRIGRERPVAYALATGAGIGTIGLAAEWGWSHVWSVIPWPSTLLPEGALLGFGMAMAGALIGAWIATRLASDSLVRLPRLRVAAVVGAVLVAVFVGVGLYKSAPTAGRVHVDLTEAQSGPARTVNATVTLEPANAAGGAEWLTATAWQGGGLVVDRLQKIGPGRFRTTQAIPVHDDWKALIRLHRGSSLTGIPLYLPDDPAIPAKGVPATAHFTRTLVADHKILQREQKTNSAGVLTPIAYGVVGGIALALLGLLAWGLHRLGAVAGGRSNPPAARARRRTEAQTAPRVPQAAS